MNNSSNNGFWKNFFQKYAGTITAERDRYFNYLINIPESIHYFENIISELENKNFELESSNISTGDQVNEKYYTTYDNKKENVAIIDDVTGVVFCLNEIEYSGVGHATCSLPGLPSEAIDIKAGDIIDFSYDNKNYQIIISMLSWGTNSYSIILKEV